MKDWDTMEKLWEHAFKDRLRIVPEEHPMLLAVSFPLLGPPAKLTPDTLAGLGCFLRMMC